MIIDEALDAALIAWVVVSIIAGLVALCANLEIHSDESVTAARQLAVLAGIGQHLVAIITSFATFLDPVTAVHDLAIVGAVGAAIALLDAGSDYSIAASRHGAVVQAAIRLDSVAIIASLTSER